MNKEKIALLVLCFLALFGVAYADLNDGLIAYFPLNGNAIDVSGNGNDGQVLEPVPCEDLFGNIDGAMCFNGDSAHTINIGNRIKPPFPFTISAWIKPDSVDGRNTIITNDQRQCPGYYYGASLEIRNGRIGANYMDGGYCAPNSRRNFATDPVMVAGAWQHVAVVFRSHLDIQFYRNSIEFPVTWVDGSGSSIRYSAANGFIGLIYGALDDVRVYNLALSSNDISELFQSGTDRLGNTLQTAPAYDFSLVQDTQATGSIHLFNPSSEDQIASLEILNSHSELDFSFQSQDPITVNAKSLQTIPVFIEATNASSGVYDDILLKISTENGETLYSNLCVTIVEEGTQDLPDLGISSQNIRMTDYTIGESATLQAVIHNKGLTSASNVSVQFYEFGDLLGETVLDEVPAEGSGIATITIPIGTSEGDHLIQVVVDPSDAITELAENNNEASRIVTWGAQSENVGNILVTGSSPSTVYAGDLFTVSGRAVYDVYADGVRYTNYAVKGGSIEITLKDSNGNAWIYGGVHTDTNGNFLKYLQAPSTTGAYRIFMTVTDKTFTGNRELVFEVVEKPDLPQQPPPPPTVTGSGYWTYYPPSGTSDGYWDWTWTSPPVNEPITQTDLRVFSENIYFSENNPDPDEEITIFAKILYWATSSNSIAENVPVNLYVTYPGEQKEKFGSALIPSLSVGSPDFGSRYVYGTWKNKGAGIYIVEVEIDPIYEEENMLNNAATRAIIVGEVPSGQGAISGHVSDAVNGIGGIVVQLIDTNGTLGSTVTNSNGFYLFENILVGDYDVQIIVPEGYHTDDGTKSVSVNEQSITENVDFQIDQQMAPISDAGPDQTVNEGVTVTLDGSDSSDPDNEPLTYQWIKIAGPSVALDLTDPVHPTFTAPQVQPGGATITFELIVSNGELTSEPDQVNITVKNVNHPPIADAGEDKIIKENSPVELDGTGSYDPDGETLTYTWIQTAGTIVSLSNDTTAQPSFTAPTVGSTGETLIFKLTVNDGTDSATDTVSIIVENVNHAPIADAGSDQTKNEGSVVTLDGSNSSDPDNDPLTYQWNQTAGLFVNLDLTNPIHPIFTAPQVSTGGATITFELIIYDGELSSEPDVVNVNILNLNDPPVCEFANAEPDFLWPPNHKFIPIEIISVTDPENSNVDITIDSVTQDEPVNGLGDGDTSPDAVIQDDNVLLRVERAGGGNGRVYQIGFTANDGSGGVCSGNVSVCVPHDKRGAGCIDDGQNYNSQ